MFESQLLLCQNFLEIFLSKVNPDDQLPVKVSSSTICKIEVIGSVLDWIIQYLHQWSCPDFLVTSLAKIILDEIRLELNEEDCPFYNKDVNAYFSLPLMQYVVSKVQHVCKRYMDPEKLQSIPLTGCNLPISVFTTKNKRRQMEDRHVIIDDLPKLFNKENCESISYYAIFDGHNGTGAATYSATHLHQFLAESQYFPMYAEQALTDAFKFTDKNLLEKLDSQITRSGTTAVVALIYHENRMLHVAWAGDSEAFLSSKGRVQRLVLPHKAERKDEIERIQKNGGAVLFWHTTWRVNGQLAISRSIGDADHKTCIISVPDIVSLQLTGDEDFIILACDGLWDCVDAREAAKLVYEQVSAEPDKYEQISQRLVELAKRKGSGDNITTIVVFLTDPQNIKCCDTDMETATAESFPSNQNGAIKYRPLNNFDHADDDDDFGPETNVDNIDDVMSQAVPTKKSFLDSDTIKTSFDQLHTDVLDQVDEESKIGVKEADKILDNGKEALSESEDDDEEGWDYFKAGANSKENSPQKLNNSDELSSSEMDYTLNPNAEEFVPVSPKSTRDSSQSPDICSYPMKNTERLLKEEIIASSPLKGQEKNMDDVDVPSIDDFDKEIKKRPSNIMPRFDSDEPNVENYELNNGDALLEHSLENATNDNTYASTKAVFGDDSTYATNLEEVNKVLNDVKDNYEEHHAAENGIDEAISKYQEYNHEHEHNDTNDLIKSTSDLNADNVSENGAFENEDYPSIVEKEKLTEDESNSILSSSNITYNRDSGKYDADKEVPPFEDLLEKHDDFVPTATDDKDPFDCLSFTNDSTSEVIHKMTNFDYGTTLQSSLLDNDTNFGANTVTSPMLEIYNDDLPNSTNPFAVEAKNEKEIAEEKEIDDDEDVQIKQFDPFNDQVDFKDPFQTPFAEASAPQLSVFEKAPIEEPVVLKEEVHQVEANPESDQHVDSTQLGEPQPKDDISAQILDLDEFELHKSGSEDLDEQKSDSGATSTTNEELPVSSVDMETPYIHECSRISEKPDSVHEPVPSRHYDDLYPDTMESDKLELELRESDKKDDKFDTKPQDDEFQSLMVDLVKPAEVVPETKIEEPPQVTNEAEFVQKDDAVQNDDISVPEVSSNVETGPTNEKADNTSTPPPTAVAQNQQENVVSIAEAVDKINSQEQESNASAITAAVAAVGVATAVAAGVAISQDKKEAPPKKASIIRKPEEKPKAPAKTTTKAPLSSAKPKPATTTSTMRNTTSTLAPKKPATTAAKTTPVKSTVTARPSATKPTTPTTKSTLTSKPLTAKPTTPTAPKPITKPGSPLKSRPTTASSLSSPRSTTTKPLTNGDVSSTTKTAPRKPSLSAIKKTVSSPTTSAPPASTKPAVNLATRTSLAPKPKLGVEKPKTTSTIAKRPLSAPSATKVANNKDSKDITNKRLSTSKPTSRLSTTTSKTESKVNAGLKSTKSVVKKASDSDQSEATKTVNGNA